MHAKLTRIGLLVVMLAAAYVLNAQSVIDWRQRSGCAPPQPEMLRTAIRGSTISSGSVNINFQCPIGANVVAVGLVYNGSNSDSAVTYHGTALTKITRVCQGTSTCAEMWRLLDATSECNGRPRTLSVTLPTSADRGAFGGFALLGTDGAGVRAFDTAAQQGNSPITYSVSSQPGDLGLDVCYLASDTASFGPEENEQTQEFATLWNFGAGNHRLLMSSQTATGSTMNFGWNFFGGSTNISCVAASFRPD